MNNEGKSNYGPQKNWRSQQALTNVKNEICNQQAQNFPIFSKSLDLNEEAM